MGIYHGTIRKKPPTKHIQESCFPFSMVHFHTSLGCFGGPFPIGNSSLLRVKPRRTSLLSLLQTQEVSISRHISWRVFFVDFRELFLNKKNRFRGKLRSDSQPLKVEYFGCELHEQHPTKSTSGCWGIRDDSKDLPRFRSPLYAPLR